MLSRKILGLVLTFMVLGPITTTLPVSASTDRAEASRQAAAERRSLREIAKERQRQLIMQKARAFFAQARLGKKQAQKAWKERLKQASLKQGTAAHHSLPPDGPPRPAAGFARRSATPFGALGTTALGADVLVNDTTAAERAVGAGQGEISIAAHGTNVLAAWNDGWGFETFGDLQGYGYSTDGGVTWIDGGDLPKPANSFWVSDPVVTLNEKTGEFYYVGLIEPSATTNGIGIIRATFSGGAVVWDTPKIIAQGANTTVFFDKPWAAADSATGRVYVTNTTFNAFGNLIEFRRSTTAWNAWSGGLEISNPDARGFLQGSRVVVGPTGQVYTTWKEVGPVDADTLQFRVSLDQGTSFQTRAIAATMFDNFGTGAPGFNRERGIGFPSIAVDRTHGTFHGRVYMTWNDCINFWRDLDPLLVNGPPGGILIEAENNDTFGQAQTFTPGQRIIGRFSTVDTDPNPPDTGDIDIYKFTATQGTSYTFVADSIEASLYSMRVICSDQVTRLNLGGDLSTSASDPTPSEGFITWTCPASGTYFLRMFPNIPGSLPGFYTVWSVVNSTGPEPSRDQRDIMTVFSTNSGTTWSAPVRVNDDPPLYDNWLPEIAVGGTGQVFTFWYDWRDAAPSTCGGESQVYLGRSENGSASWSNVGPVSDVISQWTQTFSNITPNQGDYLALYANPIAVYAAWADGRNGDPDVYAAAIPLDITPALVSLAGADAEFDRVTLNWYSGSPRVSEAYVYRLDGGEWTLKGAVTRDVRGQLRYVDEDVRPGVRYSYRLGVRIGDQELFMGEVSVVVPGRATLSLSGVTPNPTDRDMWVTFALPDAAPASLSLWDISGRRLRSREVGPLGGGRHVLNVAEGLTLAPGVYILRLERAGQVVTERVSVLR